jgi:hypothetical protein
MEEPITDYLAKLLLKAGDGAERLSENSLRVTVDDFAFTVTVSDVDTAA